VGFPLLCFVLAAYGNRDGFRAIALMLSRPLFILGSFVEDAFL